MFPSLDTSPLRKSIPRGSPDNKIVHNKSFKQPRINLRHDAFQNNTNIPRQTKKAYIDDEHAREHISEHKYNDHKTKVNVHPTTQIPSLNFNRKVNSSTSTPFLRASPSKSTKQHKNKLRSPSRYFDPSLMDLSNNNSSVKQVLKHKENVPNYNNDKHKRTTNKGKSSHKTKNTSAVLPSLLFTPAGKPIAKQEQNTDNMTPTLPLDLDRRLIETHSLLRLSFKTPGAFHTCVTSITTGLNFVQDLIRIAAQNQTHTGELFQDLLLILNTEGIGMEGHIMRTARRSNNLEKNKLTKKKHKRGKVKSFQSYLPHTSALAKLSDQALYTLVMNCHALRQMIRIKIEDTNDIKLVQQALKESMCVLDDLLKEHQKYLQLTKFKMSIEEFIVQVSMF